MSGSVRVLRTKEEIKIFTDPYRMRIIKAYGSSKVPLTVTQVAHSINEVPAKVHYHLMKLLSINILELDHIQVIKGINAKYYRLVTDEFKIEVDRSDPKTIDKQFMKITGYVFSEIDEFKEEILDMSKIQNVTEEQNQTKGLFGRREIYLSDDEFTELQKYVKDYVSTKSKKDPNKKKYAALIGAFRRL